MECAGCGGWVVDGLCVGVWVVSGLVKSAKLWKWLFFSNLGVCAYCALYFDEFISNYDRDEIVWW